ncbi:hypothetical protein RBH26_20905 [Natronolimnohabitans sp. A-GB9]|uniref:hypothetical protein n=1 Tax=Natronolimnohabitans sp. A-GB9 TaxID=3069757 RepID=UPI0027B5DDC1|nr:hypothetical protein [Natronolimnohabitans sp. A-GB9]MDQ2052905.1 hypothetical protein [Natronolimnohabitans sp. A-GB9]
MVAESTLERRAIFDARTRDRCTCLICGLLLHVTRLSKDENWKVLCSDCMKPDLGKSPQSYRFSFKKLRDAGFECQHCETQFEGHHCVQEKHIKGQTPPSIALLRRVAAERGKFRGQLVTLEKQSDDTPLGEYILRIALNSDDGRHDVRIVVTLCEGCHRYLHDEDMRKGSLWNLLADLASRKPPIVRPCHVDHDYAQTKLPQLVELTENSIMRVETMKESGARIYYLPHRVDPSKIQIIEGDLWYGNQRLEDQQGPEYYPNLHRCPHCNRWFQKINEQTREHLKECIGKHPGADQHLSAGYGTRKHLEQTNEVAVTIYRRGIVNSKDSGLVQRVQYYLTLYYEDGHQTVDEVLQHAVPRLCVECDAPHEWAVDEWQITQEVETMFETLDLPDS